MMNNITVRSAEKRTAEVGRSGSIGFFPEPETPQGKYL